MAAVIVRTMAKNVAGALRRTVPCLLRQGGAGRLRIAACGSLCRFFRPAKYGSLFPVLYG